MRLEDLFDQLSREHDVDGCWPSGSPFEVMVGALLTQQTTWETVAKVLDRMRGAGLLEVRPLADCRLERLQEQIRPVGFFRRKSVRLKELADHMLQYHDGDVESMLAQDTGTLRSELLSLSGIGPETADSILLFAAGRPKFVAAAYVMRILSRTGVFPGTDYEEVQTFVERRVPANTDVYRELYALLVHHAKTICLDQPICSVCCLADRCERSLRPGRI